MAQDGQIEMESMWPSMEAADAFKEIATVVLLHVKK